MPTLHFNQRFELPFKAVLIKLLNEEMKPIGYGASGFIRQEGNKRFLYTCWHVVTGYNKNDLKVPNKLPNRAYLEIQLRGVTKPQLNVETIGGMQSHVIPLYDKYSQPKKPIWLQEANHTPHADLNSINLFVPSTYDAVKIEIPNDIELSDMQVISEDDFLPADTFLLVGDKLYVVGYPYGYSAGGIERPIPIALTRFIAATQINERPKDFLMESAGAPAMSGGPVFVERESKIYLVGLYTGLIYPDYAISQSSPVTALGACADLTLCFRNYHRFVESSNMTQ